jgi:hypothetical protein
VPTFRELQARCGGVSSSVLADRLRELSEAGLTRHVVDGYALTTAGRDLPARLGPAGGMGRFLAATVDLKPVASHSQPGPFGRLVWRC